MKSKVIYGSIIPAIRMFTGVDELFRDVNQEVVKPEFLHFERSVKGDGTCITLLCPEDRPLVECTVDVPFEKFADYCMLVDNLPVIGFDKQAPIYHIKSMVGERFLSILLVDYNEDRILNN